MAFYTKAQELLLIDLANEANPGLNYDPLALTTTRLGVPYPYRGEVAGIWDTTVEVYPRDASKFIGKALIHYRRIDLAKLFKYQPVQMDRWYDGTLTTAILVEELNARFGTTFVIEDFPETTWSSSQNVQTVDVLGTSLCYQGTLSFIWHEGKRDLDQTLSPDQVDENGHYDYRDALSYWSDYPTPQDDLTKPLLTHVGFNIDYSSQYDAASVLANGSKVAANSRLLVLLQRFNAITGIDLDPDRPHTEYGGLKDLLLTRVTLPNLTLAPEANGDRFRYVVVITAQEDSWFRGRLLFHYNRVSLELPFDGLFFNEVQSLTLKYHEVLLDDMDAVLTIDTLDTSDRYPRVLRRLDKTIPVTLDHRYHTFDKTVAFELDTAVTKDTPARFTLRQSTATGPILGTSRVFELTQWTGAILSSFTDNVDYDELTSITIDNVPYRNRSLVWRLFPRGGSFHQTIEGTVTPVQNQAVIEVMVPLTEVTQQLRGYFLRLYHPDGTVLLTTPDVIFNPVEVTTTTTRYTDNFSLLVNKGDAIFATLAGGGGGGTGNGTSGSGSGWVYGARGGNGQKTVYLTTLLKGGVLSGVIPPGGAGATTRRQEGETADPTRLRLGNTQLALALGGGGGTMRTGNGGRGRYYVPVAGVSRTPTGGASGGSGSSVQGYSGGRASPGRKGWIELTIIRRVS